MLFWTIVFLTFNLFLLIRNPMKEISIKLGEVCINKAEGKIVKEETIISQILIIFLVILPLWIGEVIYLIYAIKLDPLIYPSIILLGYIIISCLFIKAKNPKLNTKEEIEEYRKEIYSDRKFKRILVNIIFCIYFVYMFYVLVF